MRNHLLPCVILLALALTAAACGGNSTTSPASTSTTVASPTATETFAGTLPVGGSKFYSFVVSVNGTVNVTLISVAGDNVPSTVSLGLAVGTPSGTGCTGTPVGAQAGVSPPQITLTEMPGRHCVTVSDTGNLLGPAAFTVTIDHP